ncbi:MAG: nitrilase-related carbon-nitrogen hydrolase [Candidatus Helarchaeota archaeon]
MTRLKIGLAQIAPKLGAVKQNLDKHLEIIENAKNKKVDLLIFPELSLCGYYAKDMYYEILPKVKNAIDTICKNCGNLTIILGIIEENKRIRGVLHNSAVVIENGKVVGTTQKVYLPDYGMFEDMKYFKPGNKIKVFKTRKCILGIAICEDFWHPEVVHAIALKGAEIAVLISASPFMSREIGEMLNKIRAIENTIFIAYVNNAGAQEGIVFWGGSEIVSPNGNVLVKANYVEEDFKVCEIDLNDIPRVRAGMPILRDARKAILEELLKAHGELNEY